MDALSFLVSRLFDKRKERRKVEQFITKDAVKRAIGKGLEAFTRELNREILLAMAGQQEQRELIPSKATTDGAAMQGCIAAYVTAFKKRYGEKARPDVGGRAQGCLKRLLKDYPADQIAMLLQVYLQMEDEWFKKNDYDLATFEAKFQRVILAGTTGTDKARGEFQRAKELAEEKIK